MAKIKKYYPGVKGLTYSNTKSVGVLAPQQEDPNKFTTGKFLFPEQKTLANITDRKVMSKEYLDSKGPSFGDKAGNFLENYGGTIANLSTALLPLMLKRKKANERPYEKGSKNINLDMQKRKAPIKMYQMGTPNLVPQGTQKSITDTANNIGNSFQAANQNLVNQGTGLFNKANDFNKNMTSNVVGGVKDMAGKAMGAVGNFAQSQMKQPGGALNLLFPQVGAAKSITNKLFNKGTKMIKYQDGNENLQATKGVKDFIKYLEENERNISNASIPKEVAEKFDISSLADVMPDISKRSVKGSKAPSDMEVGPTRKEMADLLRAYNKKERAAGRLGYIDMEEADRMYEQNEAMMGNKINRVPGKIETLSGKTPLIKLASIPELPEKLNRVPVEKITRRQRKENVKKDFALTKRDQDIETLSPKIARISSEVSSGSPKKVEVETPTKKIKYFDYTTEAAKGGYARALKSGIKTKEGWLTDPETGLVYKDLRKDKTSVSKNKNTSGERTSTVPPAGQELVRMSRMGENPFYNKSVGVPEPIRRDIKQKTTSTPKSQKRNEQKLAPKQMNDDFFERLTGVAKNLNAQAVKQKQKETLVQFKKSGKLRALKESLEYNKNLIGGRYKKPEAPRADLGKKGVKTYWERVKSDNVFKRKGPNDVDPRMLYDYEKINPFGKVKSEGAIDYLSTLFSMPQKEVNHLLTKRYESPLDTYNVSKSKQDRIKGIPKVLGDIATDPMMYPEAVYAGGKLVATGAVKAGKAIGGVLKKIPYGKVGQVLEKFGGKVLSEKGRISQALLHFNEDSKEREEREKNRPSFKMK